MPALNRVVEVILTMTMRVDNLLDMIFFGYLRKERILLKDIRRRIMKEPDEFLITCAFCSIQ